MKIKTCSRCQKEVAIAYRIQTQSGGNWSFVCGPCCLHYKKGNFYRYGGTWKGLKKK